ncbi:MULTISPECIES: GNAT family N-acetyltransferase [Gordonia]|jgi:hypothetical protein|uniref:hypothetical protein n=1 Tax=Gordonia TaxID=2053 RepID=UPI0032B32722
MPHHWVIRPAVPDDADEFIATVGGRVAIALYEKFGCVAEGRLYRHYRRRSGELWDAIVMGLILDTTSPGSPYT